MAIHNIAGLIRTHGAERAERVALHVDDRSITWGELDRRTNQLAQALRSEGVGSQEHVALIDNNGREYFEVLFGGAKINPVNVAVNSRLAPPERAGIVKRTQAPVLIAGAEVRPHCCQI